ncbi:hypothetical protein Pmar_PMAR004447 [Perkinsus marinus ATCC 50983]|uniref:Cation/H+ exchanger transmembrane domain-containing protein n=1 Tax=Perkinsus marinus (strain ATCC 50983 / TXsc) TaxID=423536 RepID=C5LZP2_PERM5|nr:hypothetical protein Pmar_PMAR004447 [Perkinsus marinus ATCC 50983]EEQ97710.1 hypothetical protein Pmar_PMAR004447 [Perkinsus marinus ATCC 50983]|eukprot:XP_002764993.1 hypothetical protein Pmar_PMAR004447 [Perkinsus marinus ATCC 50983]
MDEGKNAGFSRARRPAREVALEEIIGERARVLTVEEKRNGLGMRCEGDKTYKHPEFSVGFFKEGGLIPGAGFIRGMYPRTAPLNSVCWESFRAERPDLVQKRLPFREVDRLAEQQAAKGSVEELGEWERNILREIPGANYAEYYVIAPGLGLSKSWDLYTCLCLGSILSATDPVAVYYGGIDETVVGITRDYKKFVGNTLVFFISGGLLGRALVRSVQDNSACFTALGVMYLVMLVTRGVMLLLLWPFLGRIGPKVHWRSLTVIFWGGLRGAVALSLAVMVTKSEDAFPDVRLREELMFIVGGCACLTLLVNATTAHALVNILGFTELTTSKKILLKNVDMSIAEAAREM